MKVQHLRPGDLAWEIFREFDFRGMHEGKRLVTISRVTDAYVFAEGDGKRWNRWNGKRVGMADMDARCPFLRPLTDEEKQSFNQKSEKNILAKGLHSEKDNV